MYAVREDNAGMTIIQLPENDNKTLDYIANHDGWHILARWETDYESFQQNIKVVTDNFAFGPLRFSSVGFDKFRMETIHMYHGLYNAEVFKPNIKIRFNPMLIWEELENNFIEEDTEITCELIQHPTNNSIMLKIQFPEYYIMIASLRDD
jgi:hypothetical protein